MQLRRVLLLFALVLGLSALVASVAPPPEERSDDAPAEVEPRRPPTAPNGAVVLRLAVPPKAHGRRVQTRRALAGSRLAVQVSVPGPGDVTLPGLGLRQSADPLAPARFDLVAPARGRQAVVFVPIRGRARTVGRLVFAEPATVTPQALGR